MFKQALVFQIVSTAFCPVTRHQWKSLFAPSLEVFIHIDEVPPESVLLQDEQSQLSQPLLTGDAPVPSSSL